MAKTKGKYLSDHQSFLITSKYKAALITDMLYSVDFKGQDGSKQKAFLYLLLEHLNEPEPLTPWRMMQYTCRIIDHHLTPNKGNGITDCDSNCDLQR